MRHTEDSSLGNSRAGLEFPLNLFGINVESTTDDHVFTAPNDKQVPVLVQIALVTGREPATIPESALCRLGQSPVAGQNIRPAHLDVTNHAIGLRAAILGHNAQLDALQRGAD